MNMANSKDLLTVDIDRITGGMETDYSDGDIVLLQNINELTQKDSYLIDMMMIAFCEKGKVQMEINNETHTIGVGDLAIFPPKTIIENIMVSTDVEFKAVGISYEAAQRSVHVGKNAWDMLQYITKYPIMHIPQSSTAVVHNYYELLSQKLQEKRGPYYKEMMQSLFNCIYYEMCNLILPLIKENNVDEDLTHGVQICKRFFEMLSESEGRERSVAKFAKRLCITPKYLSAVVKTESGKAALDWIHAYTMRIIERQLRYSDKTVLEIATDLNFTSLSFFGKFVKNHTGMSPTNFRNSLLQKNERQ